MSAPIKNSPCVKSIQVTIQSQENSCSLANIIHKTCCCAPFIGVVYSASHEIKLWGKIQDTKNVEEITKLNSKKIMYNRLGLVSEALTAATIGLMTAPIYWWLPAAVIYISARNSKEKEGIKRHNQVIKFDKSFNELASYRG